MVIAYILAIILAVIAGGLCLGQYAEQLHTEGTHNWILLILGVLNTFFSIYDVICLTLYLIR